MTLKMNKKQWRYLKESCCPNGHVIASSIILVSLLTKNVTDIPIIGLQNGSFNFLPALVFCISNQLECSIICFYIQWIMPSFTAVDDLPEMTKVYIAKGPTWKK